MTNSFSLLPNSIITIFKGFFDIEDNANMLINKNYYETKYTSKSIIIKEKNVIKMIYYIKSKINLRNVEELDLSNIKSIDNIIKIVGYMPTLKKLNLYNSNVTDDNIKFLLDQKCSSTISDLNIGRCSILTNNCMIYIAGFRNLERLNLSYCCDIIENGIEYLSSHKKLSYLNLSNCCNANNNLVHVAKLINLKELDISKNYIHINNIMHLAHHKQLNKLHIDDNIDLMGIMGFEKIMMLSYMSIGISFCNCIFNDMSIFILTPISTSIVDLK
jgi:Leucine-rich repeat (LRR) protein